MLERDSVTPVEYATSTDGAPRVPAAARLAGGNHGSFRRRIRAGAIGLLILNVAVGLFARQQQHAIIDYALNIYDTAFISTNYIHLAQVSLQHYVDERLSSAPPDDGAKPGEDLQNVLDNLDVAIERSDRPARAPWRKRSGRELPRSATAGSAPSS
jgi:hypothetical protein